MAYERVVVTGGSGRLGRAVVERLARRMAVTSLDIVAPSYTLPKEVIMVGVVPHMHLLGKSMNVTATLPDKRVKTLIDIQNWNYNWQDEYYYERPFKLPAGTRLDVVAVFDKSDGNPSNPSSPPKRVTWGDGTKDEMLFCFFLLSAEQTEDLIHVIFDNLKHDTQQPRKAVEK